MSKYARTLILISTLPLRASHPCNLRCQAVRSVYHTSQVKPPKRAKSGLWNGIDQMVHHLIVFCAKVIILFSPRKGNDLKDPEY